MIFAIHSNALDEFSSPVPKDGGSNSSRGQTQTNDLSSKK
jgi:hypothetical protein